MSWGKERNMPTLAFFSCDWLKILYELSIRASNEGYLVHVVHFCFTSNDLERALLKYVNTQLHKQGVDLSSRLIIHKRKLQQTTV